MENLFASAKFGDRFKTRDGRMAIYVSRNPYANESYVLIEGYKSAELMQNDGHFWATEGREYKDDIVSRYEEPIDEEELDSLAESCCIEDEGEFFSTYLDGFKEGYRKAKQEII